MGCLPWLVVLVALGGVYSGLRTGTTTSTLPSELGPTSPAISQSSPASPNTEADKFEVARTLYVTATALNVRSGPSPSARVLGKLYQGSSVRALGVSSGWVEIEMDGGASGWMSSQFLSERAPAPATTAVIERPPQQPTVDRDAIVRALIAESQASYPGNCPCPENRMRNGRRCGGNSAWSKGGGYSPLCYASDVSEEMIQAFLARR